MSSIKIVIERKSNNTPSNPSEEQKTDIGQPSGRQHRNIFKRRYSVILAWAALGILIICLATYVVTLPTASHSSEPHTQETLAQIKDFSPYFFSNSDTALGFRLASNGITYSDSVLFIGLVNAANLNVAITEQPLPATLANSNDVIGDEPVTGVNGVAAIAHIGGRITGSMISQDHRTLITLTCPIAVGSNTLMDLMRALSPITKGH